ncbi:hypothetical protein [Sphingomonas sp. G-3-2-10]|uniref:hypothetical protein n=1 Tax=Sphingomonas sp. G-3-2-10 TaxID=2728838 RepID=UPI00146F0336|nr:hypothetical protein [Sphingomonas sp. G-3-2-10]NML06483.1 hypothetical protein [Sphingomonas sp. G-3-2-10]
MSSLIAAVLAIAAWAAPPGDFTGPGRFCGYSPIIDLAEGERIEPLVGGIHAGTFRWEGAFGTLEVAGIGWAARPPGRLLAPPTGKGHARFAQRREEGRYVVAIWNRGKAAAYFRSATPLTGAQLEAIQRVDLFEEGQEPQGCNYRTIFSWE